MTTNTNMEFVKPQPKLRRFLPELYVPRPHVRAPDAWADRLALLAGLCARSYKWKWRTFEAEMAERGATSLAQFGRGMGPSMWRIKALLWMPVSYIALLFSFVFLVSLLLAIAPISLAMGDDAPGLHAAGWAMMQTNSLIGHLIVWLASCIAAIFNFVVGWIAWLFAVLASWLPSSVVSFFLTLGGYVQWLWASLLAIAYDVIFWIPVDEEWLRNHPPGWGLSVLYEIRVVLGLALFSGSTIGLFLFFFPWFASARAFAFANSDGKSATIIFCGSTLLDNLTINACVWRYSGPRRHLGFHRAWSHIKPGIEAWLAEKCPKDAEIFLAGHSLGGAIAEIAAFDLADRYPIGLVAALGSSRIGGPEMREIYKDRRDKKNELLQEKTWHISHADDTIPRLPPTKYFMHVGTGFLLTTEGELEYGTRRSIFLDYLETTEQTGFFRFFFNQEPLSADEIGPADETWSLKPASRSEQFKRNAKIYIFGARAAFPFYVVAAVIPAVLFWIYFMLGYYGFRVIKGLSRDHKARLYRKALEKRASRISNGLLEQIMALRKMKG